MRIRTFMVITNELPRMNPRKIPTCIFPGQYLAVMTEIHYVRIEDEKIIESQKPKISFEIVGGPYRRFLVEVDYLRPFECLTAIYRQYFIVSDNPFLAMYVSMNSARRLSDEELFFFADLDKADVYFKTTEIVHPRKIE